MQLPALSAQAVLRSVQLSALVAQLHAGGTLEDWQLDRLIDPGSSDVAGDRRRLRRIIEAEHYRQHAEQLARQCAAAAARKRLHTATRPAPGTKAPRRNRCVRTW